MKYTEEQLEQMRNEKDKMFDEFNSWWDSDERKHQWGLRDHEHNAAWLGFQTGYQKKGWG